MTIKASEPWQIGARGHFGFLWPHRASSWILVEGHAPAFELYAQKRVSGNRPWHHDYDGPSYGLGLLYTDLANQERIGTCIRLIPYFRFPLARGKHSEFGLRVGWGIGYVTHSYDPKENNKQIAIGSSINTAIQIMTEYERRFGRTSISAGLGIDHWSNGSYQQPNLGLNYLSLSLGLSYSLSDQDAFIQQIDSTQSDRPKREQSLVFSFGVNESIRPETGQHTVYSIAGHVQWRISRKSAFGLGPDFFNKGSLAARDEDLAQQPRAQYTQVGIHGGYALLIGDGEIYFQMGTYLYTPVPDESGQYHRLGCRYKMNNGLVFNFSLKSHYAIADHWEIGLGYNWQ